MTLADATSASEFKTDDRVAIFRSSYEPHRRAAILKSSSPLKKENIHENN
jgi:hypothetical protein